MPKRQAISYRMEVGVLITCLTFFNNWDFAPSFPMSKTGSRLTEIMREKAGKGENSGIEIVPTKDSI